MNELAGLRLKLDGGQEAPSARIHVAGEAYSDYHGFMEGALRSSIFVLSKILGGPSAGSQQDESSLEWLGKHNDGRGPDLIPQENSREYLDDWILALNSDQGDLYYSKEVLEEREKEGNKSGARKQQDGR